MVRALIFILLVVTLLRIPSLFEPRLYADEQIYLTIGMAMRKGVVLYKEIYDNKPPLLYVVAAIAGSVFWLRMILLAWNLLTITMFWEVAEKLVKKKLIVVATIIFAVLTTLPVWEGNIANAEIFLILFTISGVLLALKEKWWWAGVVFGIAALFKVPGAVEMGAVVIMLMRDGKWMKKTIIMTAGAGVVVGLSGIYFWLAGAGRDYFESAFAQLFPYLQSWGSGGSGGGLVIRGIILVAILVGLVIWVRNKKMVLVGAWLALALFAALLSGRPYPHYLIQVVAPLSLVLVMGNRKLAVAGVGLVLVAIIGFKFWMYPVVPYYVKFFEFATGRISREEYSAKINGDWPWVEKTVEYVRKSTMPGEKIFVWGTNPEIYAYSGRLPASRYTVAYHIKDFRAFGNVVEELKKNRPRLIIWIKDEEKYRELEELITIGYIEVWEGEKAIIYRLWEM